VSMTNPTNRVEIITSVQRSRRWTASEKVRIVEETFEPGLTASLAARRHGVAPNRLFTWRRLVAQGALTAAGSGEEVVPASDYRALRQSQVRELHRLLGKKTLEAEILKPSSTSRAQKDSCSCHRCCRRTASSAAPACARSDRSGRPRLRFSSGTVTARTVEVFHRGKRVAAHVRSSSNRKHTTVRDHTPSSPRRYADWTPERLRRQGGEIGRTSAVRATDNPCSGRT
jgi:transposase